MKRFKFNLESLLTIRSWEEQRARQTLSEANVAVAELAQRLDSMAEEKEQAFASWRPAPGARYTAADRLRLDAQVADFARGLSRIEKSLAEARQMQTTALAGVARAARQKRVVELLRERRQREYTAEVYRQEAAEIEDIFNARRSMTQ